MSEVTVLYEGVVLDQLVHTQPTEHVNVISPTISGDVGNTFLYRAVYYEIHSIPSSYDMIRQISRLRHF